MNQKYIVAGVLSTALLLPSLISNISQAATEASSSQSPNHKARTVTDASPSSETQNERSDDTESKRSKKEDTSSERNDEKSKDQLESNQNAYPYHFDVFAPFKVPSQSSSNTSFFDTLFDSSDSSSSLETPSSSDSATSVTDESQTPSESSSEEHSNTTENESRPSSETPDDRSFFDNLNAILSGELDAPSSSDSQANENAKESLSEETPSTESTQDDESHQNPSDEEETSSEETTNETPTDQETDAKTPEEEPSQSDQASESSTESVGSEATINALLDEYSEKAEKTQNEYQDNPKSSSSSVNDKTSRNPQIPSTDTYKNDASQVPKQSFKNDTDADTLRQTTLFQEITGANHDDASFKAVPNQSTRQFINSIAKEAHDIGQDHDIYASIMIAQAILESDSGRSALSQAPNYNLFGMKGAYQGQSSNFDTLESNGHSMYQINASFRKYPNLKASLNDYADLIKHGIDGNPDIYKAVWKSQSVSYRTATSELVGTYATDPNYDTKLKSLIETYDLERFDQKKMPTLLKSKDIKETRTADGSPFKAFSPHGVSPYPFGQCTWYVYHRMGQFGLDIAGDMGDAKDWTYSSLVKGYSVSDHPRQHSAVVFSPGELGADRYYGHVAFVEKVNQDGSIVISESNVKGLGVISYRTIDAESAKTLDYIQGES
ncbi:amidase domain-containing protein [Staphylococcus felis]|uniref:amidase domain-containing protein n=1 Tax=Staphylococcus felis TaxID=46127 RepID=UPI000E24D727|nr:amidase domain-containing protein [Staphylococcus felis]REH96429.1 amidase domain-containing protein [Staphylococcus felis]